jgi:AcrR family transcriptional regulator
MTTGQGLRERKKERTRQALITAALELFEERGYDETTIAGIAAGADVSTRTFFSYFPSKEEILFADPEERLALAFEVIDGRRPDEQPADVLVRAMSAVFDRAGHFSREFVRAAPVRLRMIFAVPAVQGVALRRLLSAQQRLARRLHAAFPDRLDAVEAAALVGALVGAVTNTMMTVAGESDGIEELLTGDPERFLVELRRAVGIAMRGIDGRPPTG